MTYTFEDIEVKTNAVELLDKALSKKKQRCVVTTGAMTDPYLPLEKELLQMRRCLEVIEKHRFGVSVLTKSDLVLRDLDILERINETAKSVVQMTLTTYDEKLCSIVEPNVCTTKARVEALKKVGERGIPTFVWLCPILPHINDTAENIQGLLDYCKQADVKGILTFGVGMTLRYGNREYFYQKLDQHFPGLKKQYMRDFGSSYGIRSKNSAELSKIIKTFCKKNNMLYGEKQIFSFISEFPNIDEQISLF